MSKPSGGLNQSGGGLSESSGGVSYRGGGLSEPNGGVTAALATAALTTAARARQAAGGATAHGVHFWPRFVRGVCCSLWQRHRFSSAGRKFCSARTHRG